MLARNKPPDYQRELKYELASSGAPIHSIHWIKGPIGWSRRMFVTISQSVWLTITVWELPRTPDGVSQPRKCAVWSPRGAIFRRLCMNSEWNGGPDDGLLAVLFHDGAEYHVEILQLSIEIGSSTSGSANGLKDTEDLIQLRSIKSIPTKFSPTAMKGNLLAVSNEVAQTTIWDWKNDLCANLQHPTELGGIWQNDHCLEVAFTHESVLVVRARSVHLFPSPILRSPEIGPITYQPIAQCSFGWIESVSISLSPTVRTIHGSWPEQVQPGSIQILIRAERDNAWESDLHTLRLYTIQPNAEYRQEDSDISIASNELENAEPAPVPSVDESQPSVPQSNVPYLFPPILTAEVHSTHGPLRLADVFLGSYGTAFWIQPQDRSASGLIWGYHDELQHQQLHDQVHAQVQANLKTQYRRTRQKHISRMGRMSDSHIGLVSSEAVWGFGLGAGVIGEGADLGSEDEGLEEDWVRYTGQCESLVSTIFPGVLAGGLLGSAAEKQRSTLSPIGRQRSREFELLGRERTKRGANGERNGLYEDGVLRAKEIDRMLDEREDYGVSLPKMNGRAMHRRSASHAMGISGRPVIQNALNDWTALDYDEEMGRVILGSRSGSVTVIEL
ncbi:hypothetical protein AX16_010854 [Volvariella volvacea WC 439]|nr:hypothetical protein AX16_010854 [Volvariella volvacea WC 439]